MKKYLLIIPVLIALHFPVQAFAISGTCSDHGGVDCSVMADWDGSAICNDGWRDSTESFYSTLKCKALHHLCTQAESNQIDQKYYLAEKSKKMDDISKEMMSLPDIYSSTDISLIRQTAIRSLEISGRYNIAMGEYYNAWNQDMRECWALGDKAYSVSITDIYKKQQALLYQQQKDEQDSLNSASCPTNSHYDSDDGKCYCNVGYTNNGNQCMTFTQNCQASWGSNSYADNIGKCNCNTGYQLNVSQTECVTIPATPTIPPQPINKKVIAPPVVLKTPIIAQQPTNQVSSTTITGNTTEAQIQPQTQPKPQTKPKVSNNIFSNIWSFIKNIFK